MGVLKAKVNGVWVPVSQGFDPYHQQLSALSAGGQVNAGASGSVVSLTTPAIPVGRQLLVTMTVHVRQTTASAFDLNMTWPAGIGIVAHQFGAGVNATGQIVSMTRVVPTTGAALTFSMSLNAWGAQAVLYSPQSNIAVTVMPLPSAGLNAIESFSFTHPGGSFTNTTAKVIANLTLPARSFKRFVIIAGFEQCSWGLVAGGQYDISLWLNGSQSRFVRGIPGVSVTLPNEVFVVDALATPLFEVKAQMVDAATRDLVNGMVNAICYPT